MRLSSQVRPSPAKLSQVQPSPAKLSQARPEVERGGARRGEAGRGGARRGEVGRGGSKLRRERRGKNGSRQEDQGGQADGQSSYSFIDPSILAHHVCIYMRSLPFHCFCRLARWRGAASPDGGERPWQLAGAGAGIARLGGGGVVGKLENMFFRLPATQQHVFEFANN